MIPFAGATHASPLLPPPSMCAAARLLAHVLSFWYTVRIGYIVRTNYMVHANTLYQGERHATIQCSGRGRPWCVCSFLCNRCPAPAAGCPAFPPPLPERSGSRGPCKDCGPWSPPGRGASFPGPTPPPPPPPPPQKIGTGSVSAVLRRARDVVYPLPPAWRRACPSRRVMQINFRAEGLFFPSPLVGEGRERGRECQSRVHFAAVRCRTTGPSIFSLACSTGCGTKPRGGSPPLPSPFDKLRASSPPRRGEGTWRWDALMCITRSRGK